MTPRLALAAASTAALALFATPAQAVLPSGNIVRNGDAEEGQGATNATDAPPVPGWDTFPNYTAVVYGTGAFPSLAESASVSGGRNFFAGGPESGFGDASYATQLIDLSGAAPEIDAGNVQATLTADVGGFAGQDDAATISAVFTNPSTGSVNAALGVGPVTREDRGGATRLLRRTSCSTVTAGARSAYLQVFASRQSGQGTYNDGYADNISVTLSTAPCPAAPEAPLPPAEPPQPGVSANAEAVRGKILVKRPGGTGFQELGKDARSIPIGSEVDASRGTVLLETAANRSGKTQKARFYDSSFVMTQTRGSRPVTDLTLTGRLGGCRAGRDQVGTAARRSRRLWGNGTGRFRTRGRYASASVRGTKWSMTDTCASTTVRAARGTVIVRDLAKRRNITLKAPRTYTARAPRR